MNSYYRFRAISGLLAYPSIANSVPSYYFSGTEYEPLFKAIILLANEEITQYGLLLGVLRKYPQLFWEAVRAIENSHCVPCEAWVKTQLENIKKRFDNY